MMKWNVLIVKIKNLLMIDQIEKKRILNKFRLIKKRFLIIEQNQKLHIPCASSSVKSHRYPESKTP